MQSGIRTIQNLDNAGMLLKKSKLISGGTIEISGSKSISNRLLILEKLLSQLHLKNLSDSEDTKLLQAALAKKGGTIDVHHAGTAMRFLTAYFSVQPEEEVVLTGSERMKQRPIQNLVEALRDLGADIQYLEKEGFPPLRIRGKKLTENTVTIPASVSSQFITALMLIGITFPEGLSISLTGHITSKPYLDMTLKILRTLNIPNSWEDNLIKISPPLQTEKYYKPDFVIESDWSSASYFYSMAAISRESVSLRCFKPHSLQGDSILKEIYWQYFGVNTISEGAASEISLIPDGFFSYPELIQLDMNDCPDIAQTLCVSATAMQIPFHLTGLETLKIKETDRLLALKNELFKIGCISEITDDSIWSTKFFEPHEKICIDTYHDHRMAMSFAPFCLLRDIEIKNPEVVVKSYPQFWEDLKSITEPHEE